MIKIESTDLLFIDHFEQPGCLRWLPEHCLTAVWKIVTKIDQEIVPKIRSNARTAVAMSTAFQVAPKVIKKNFNEKTTLHCSKLEPDIKDKNYGIMSLLAFAHRLKIGGKYALSKGILKSNEVAH